MPDVTLAMTDLEYHGILDTVNTNLAEPPCPLPPLLAGLHRTVLARAERRQRRQQQGGREGPGSASSTPRTDGGAATPPAQHPTHSGGGGGGAADAHAAAPPPGHAPSLRAKLHAAAGSVAPESDFRLPLKQVRDASV